MSKRDTYWRLWRMGNIYEKLKNEIGYYENFNVSIKKYIDCMSCYIQENRKVCVCLIDIERFRYYNYIYGYRYSDIIISKFINEMYRKAFKKYYIQSFIGDKLIILIPVGEKEKVEEVVDNIFRLCNEKINIDGRNITLNYRVGISVFPENENDPRALLKYAEIALDYAKEMINGKYEFFKKYMLDDILKHNDILNSMEVAIRKKEFILYYQPLIDIAAKKVYGIEALLRWNSEELGVVSPEYFIDILESNKMIREVGKFVFKEACSKIRELKLLGYGDLCISINMSKAQFEDPLFLEYIDDTLSLTKVNPKLITIEITERVLMLPTENVLKVLTALRDKGIKIYIDDFGTQYSSLNYLVTLPIDGIKIDKSFMDRIDDCKKTSIIIKNIIKIANEIGLDVIAEGVEKIEQLEYLYSVNCNKVQGYIVGKPLDYNSFINYLDFNNLEDDLNYTKNPLE
jgi:diguanylate cyclase (GGDEF) domain